MLYDVLVRRRDAPTLLRIICRYVRPGSIIMSDCWRAYNNLTRLPQGYQHVAVNHSLHFVDPTTGAHTQNVESLWQKFKAVAKRKYCLNGRRYVDYIREFLWRQQFGNRQ
ncbi:hypothetical protein ANCDUO_01670 [Ancylostoma duodenale]|uniref:ISXO2-like transposase domain-containing protein n=1 Tax=Ancylostoma duodenale TaxID=51022 RepID=A0A0C2HEL9_9BILA|nr:hypothetical protein ANCDUO_01670 [Ancylostoma duodenale]